MTFAFTVDGRLSIRTIYRAHADCLKDLVLKLMHSGRGLFVIIVIPQQVERAMYGVQRQLRLEAVAPPARLPRSGVRGDDDLPFDAQVTRRVWAYGLRFVGSWSAPTSARVKDRSLTVAARSERVVAKIERQHIGRTLVVEIKPVQTGDVSIANDSHAYPRCRR